MTDSSAQPTAVRLVSGANRNLGIAYALWLILGIFGAHRFYLRKPGTGILYLFTAGLLGVGWIIDAFRLPGMVRRVNTIGF